MNKLTIALIAFVVAALIVALGGYLYSNFIHLYQYLIWFVALVIAVLVYIVFLKSMQPLSSVLHDRVTGLPNAYLFQENLEQAIAYASRNAQKVHILYLELKQFDSIKDSYGDKVADNVLMEVSKRLHESLRTSDIIAHIQSDIFVVIPRDIEQEKYFFEVVDKLTESINTPIIIDGDTIDIEISIGTSFYPENGLTADELMEYAKS